jgi:hypothetical protein
MEAIRDGPYNALKEQVVRSLLRAEGPPEIDVIQALGTAKPSFTANLIQRDPNPTEAQELIYKWSSASIFIGQISCGFSSAIVLIYPPSLAAADTVNI